ncbi:hypothetical protein B0A49_01381 [Cryomyces minteri]|uniref:Uncharacterized protein n=1 Tax=Cryomyces minteri TaxID=331657 RepID=A0A4U0XPQ1_9PEZI|nr:hypothetical protein B0A49_01381 [Cryomyces minteri]
MPPSYTHRQVLLAVRTLGPGTVLRAILEEVRNQTDNGNGAMALDVGTALICAPTAEEPQSSSTLDLVASTIQAPPAQRLSLRDHLRLEISDKAKVQAMDVADAEALVRLSRRVEAQMAGPQIQMSGLDVSAPDMMQTMQGLDMTGTVADTAALDPAINQPLDLSGAAGAEMMKQALGLAGAGGALDGVDLGMGAAGADGGGDLSMADIDAGDVNMDGLGSAGADDDWGLDLDFIGLGAQIAHHFAAAGCTGIALNYASREQAAVELAATLEAEFAGVKAVAIQGVSLRPPTPDTSRIVAAAVLLCAGSRSRLAHGASRDAGVLADCVKCVRESIKAFGGLDIIIGNAGWTKFSTFGDLSALPEEDWDKCWAVNVKGQMALLREAMPTFNANPEGGVFIITSSIAVNTPSPSPSPSPSPLPLTPAPAPPPTPVPYSGGKSNADVAQSSSYKQGVSLGGSSMPYSVTKAAQLHLMKCMAQTQGPKVRINAVLPGLLLTDWGNLYPPEAIKNLKERAVLKDVTNLSDCADAYVMIARNTSMTGQSVQIDAGLNVANM